MANPAIVVDFVANTKDLAAGFKDAEDKAGGFGSKLKGIAKGGALAAGAAGIGGLVATLKIGVGEWKESTKVAAQTQAVIKSTGGVAKVSAGHVDKLADSLMNKSGVDDEVIKSGENLILTFTNIRNEAGKGNDIFDQTTKAALDMSKALGTDMKDASMQLGKALNDPEKGIGRLQKSGVTFTDSQKQMIKKLQESGDTLGAQKIILGEVNKEFGGSAEAAGKTLPGQLDILKQRFANFAGMLVGKLIPVLQDTITWLRDHWPEISRAFDDFWTTVQPVLKNLWDLLKQVVQVVQDNWPLISPIVQALGDDIKNVAKVIADAIKVITDILGGHWAQAWTDAKQLVVDIFGAIKTHILNQAKIIGDAALAVGKAILQGIKDGASGIAGWVRDRIDDTRDALVNLAESTYNAAKALGGKILHGVLDGATGLYTEIHDRVQGAVNAVDDFIDAAFAKAKKVGASIKSGFIDGITGLASAVKDAINGALEWVKGELRSFHLPAIKIKGHKITPDFYPFKALAEGGLVTRPTMALIGEAGPELVVPLSGASSPAVQVRVFIGDRELTDLVRTEIVDSNTAIARTLLAGGAA